MQLLNEMFCPPQAQQRSHILHGHFRGNNSNSNNNNNNSTFKNLCLHLLDSHMYAHGNFTLWIQNVMPKPTACRSACKYFIASAEHWCSLVAQISTCLTVIPEGMCGWVSCIRMLICKSSTDPNNSCVLFFYPMVEIQYVCGPKAWTIAHLASACTREFKVYLKEFGLLLTLCKSTLDSFSYHWPSV